MDFGEKTSKLISLAQELADATPNFFDIKGPGVGDKSSNEFIQKLSSTAAQLFGHDHSQQKICGRNKFSVDFYFPDEKTVIEFAFSLDKPMNEYERDIFKCLLAMENSYPIGRLVFVSKPGGQQKMAAPGPSAIREWVLRRYDLKVDFWDLVRPI